MIDRRLARITLSILTLAFGLAAGTPPAPQVLFACTMGAKRVEVTASGDRLTYRYGRPGRPELVLSKTVGDPALGHRYQLWPRAEHRHLRFGNAAYDYVLFHRFSGPGWDREPGEDRQGLIVLRHGRVILRRHCDGVAALDQSFDYTRLHQDAADLTDLAGRDPFTSPPGNR